MAASVVSSAQGSGTSLSIATPIAGAIIVVFVSQNTTVAAPTITDSVGGTYTLNATSAVFSSSVHSLYVGYKIALGTETNVSFTPGSGGTAFGISCMQVTGAENPIAVEVVQNTNNSGFFTTVTTTAISTTVSTIVLAAVGLTASQTPSAWTGTKVMTSVGVVATPIIGGYYTANELLTSQTFTANWSGSRNSGNLVLALKAAVVPVVINKDLGNSRTANLGIASIARL